MTTCLVWSLVSKLVGMLSRLQRVQFAAEDLTQAKSSATDAIPSLTTTAILFGLGSAIGGFVWMAPFSSPSYPSLIAGFWSLKNVACNADTSCPLIGRRSPHPQTSVGREEVVWCAAQHERYLFFSTTSQYSPFRYKCSNGSLKCTLQMFTVSFE